MSTKLNPTQLELFKALITDVNKKNINVNKINELTSQPLFKTWKNVLKTICGEKISKEENKSLNQTIELHLQDLLIEYSKKKKTRFDKKLFSNILENFLNYLENDKNTLYYFLPIYNFEFNDNELVIDEFIKIRKISKNEEKFLMKYYDKFSPIKVSLSKIKYVFIINIQNDLEDPLSLAEKKIFQVLNKFKILKSGDIRSGGLYNFDKSENWNPKNKFHRIKIEPIGIISSKKYSLRKKYSKKFQTMLIQISNQYPGLENVENKNDESELEEIDNEKYNYFDRVIRRFGDALEKEDKSEKIVDFVLSLEILLVSSTGLNTLKISQRTAQFIGRNDKEKLEIWRHMIPFYNFRSGQIHEFSDRIMKVENLPPITKDVAIKKLEDWARRSILQMIYFSQDAESSKLTIKQLLNKIDQAMFDSKLNSKFLKLSKEISKQLNLS